MSNVGPIFETNAMRPATAVREVTLADGSKAQAAVTVPERGVTSAIDRSGQIVAGGVPQQFMPENLTRQGWIIQNYSTEPLYISGMGAASADGDSLMIPGTIGAGFLADQLVTGNALSIMGPTVGQKFYAREWV